MLFKQYIRKNIELKMSYNLMNEVTQFHMPCGLYKLTE